MTYYKTYQSYYSSIKHKIITNFFLKKSSLPNTSDLNVFTLIIYI